jgi:hydrogenase/urease accessory protein HupE
MAHVGVERFAAGHRHLGTVKTQAGSHDVVAFAGARDFTLADSAAAPPVGAYLVLGVEHILLGFDHLVFLLGVLVVLLRGGTWRSLLLVITAFTLAHSITLGLAATGTVVPPSRPIEILIAASIVFVGVESFFARSVAGRWKVTLPFGLIHGFGFAGALSEIGLPRDHLIPALALFNVGVEVGQLLAVAVATPLLLLLRRRLDERGRDRVVNVVAAAVVVAGSAWVLERLIG